MLHFIIHRVQLKINIEINKKLILIVVAVKYYL